MDQDSFRQLLQTPRPGASGTPTTRGSLLGQARKPTTTTKKAANEPAFKPRNIKKGKDDDKKKKDAKWRDRAAERREGKDGDFADVEAVLKEFEERNEGEEDMEDKRAYLGGDAEHSVLVRGLDRALLQQNRARLSSVTNAEADEDLEEVFSTLPTAALDTAPIQAPSKGDGKKRSRADILAELKAKRDGSAPIVVEAAPLPNNKFKPIAASGFKPIGEKKKKKKLAKEDGAGGEDGDRKKKKRKVEADRGVGGGQNEVQVGSTEAVTKEAEAAPAPPAPEPEPEPVDEDFDIFADAGEYEGVVESDSDSDADAPRPPSPRPVSGPPRRGWFDDPEPSPPPTAPLPPPQVDKGKGKAPAPNDEEGEEGEMQEEEEEQPIRLQPLASSTVPSIREILAADKAAEKEEARKARKEKKKKGQGEMTEEAKINRELQKMKALEAKKAK
ncbi:hypothetical protein PENSPDRAFT_754263 [Peniophora sp. CONT]|nr:hypothetical protein PENSPDRAFT_754263 [Peniophora sp. CONT]